MDDSTRPTRETAPQRVDAPTVTGSSVALAGPVTVAVFLNRLSDLIQQAIEAARNAGLALEIEAGREINIAIENAKNAYLEILDKTLKEVDKKVQGTLNQLQGIVDELLGHAIDSLDQLTKRTQQIVNSLPFRKRQPQLTHVLPRFVVPGRQTYDVLLQFEGNFEFAAQEEFRPSLDVSGRTFNPSGNDTQKLTFAVPVDDLMGSPARSEPTKFSYSKANLTVPWKQSGLLGGKRRRDSYLSLIGLLPVRPGTITIEYKESKTQPQVRRFGTPEYYQTSGGDGGNDDHENVPYAVSPTSGWHVVRNTSYFDKLVAEGDWSHSFSSDDGDKVVYNVTTIYHRIGTSGKVRFKIWFDESRDEVVSEDKSIAVDLRWGDSQSFDLPATTWKVIFDAFDGTHSEFIGTDLSNPFLKVRATATGLTLGTADPRKLQWP